MGSIEVQVPQLEKPLKELRSAHDVIRDGIGQVGTAERNLGQLYGSVGTVTVSYGPEQIIDLCKVNEDKAAILNGIISYFYLITPKSNTDTIASWPVGTEFEGVATDTCVEFCNSRGLLGVLREYLNRARVIFSNREHLSAELDYFRDEEIEDSTHVVIRIKVKSDQNVALDEYDAWVDWVIQNISPDNSNFFTLTVQRI